MTISDETLGDKISDFRIPHKTILTRKDLDGFLVSDAKTGLISFLRELSDAVRGQTLSALPLGPQSSVCP